MPLPDRLREKQKRAVCGGGNRRACTTPREKSSRSLALASFAVRPSGSESEPGPCSRNVSRPPSEPRTLITPRGPRSHPCFLSRYSPRLRRRIVCWRKAGRGGGECALVVRTWRDQSSEAARLVQGGVSGDDHHPRFALRVAALVPKYVEGLLCGAGRGIMRWVVEEVLQRSGSAELARLLN